MNDHWQFWIDVGGTFTDCIARSPAGALASCKVLSSGVVKGRVAARPAPDRLLDPGLGGYPDGFFAGYRVRFLGPSGEAIGEAPVAGSAADGALVLDPAAAAALAVDPVGLRFELDAGEPAPILAMRRILGLPVAQPLGTIDVRLGTTRGTNALLERRGARTALVTTAGFGDILAIGYQNRPRLFELAIRKPEPLAGDLYEVDERIAADGTVLHEPDPAAVRRGLERLRAEGVEAVAVCLLHGWRDPRHEEIVAREARAAGFAQVSVSSAVSPTIKIVARGDTTVVDAYTTPVVRGYVSEIRARMPAGRLRLMTSAGGLVLAESASGKDTILSGPAGGVVALAAVAGEAGLERAIGFDMGGTSTDVSRFSGELAYEYETEKAGVRIVAPMLEIETVAAGGGSICAFDGQKLVVGPRSSGADPGPACYGRGGPLSLTDVNLYLGRLAPEHFPFPLDAEVVAAKLDEVRAAVGAGTGRNLAREEIAAGFVRIANASMAGAIRRVSVAKGYDPRAYALVSFGGAGGQHACALARDLGMRAVLVHPYAGLLSAFGMGVADVREFGVETVLAPLDDGALAELEPRLEALATKLRAAVVAQGVEEWQVGAARRVLELRYRGQSSAIAVPAPEGGGPESPRTSGSGASADPSASRWRRAFEDEHDRLYGHRFAGRGVEIAAARVEVTGAMEKPALPSRPERRRRLAGGTMRQAFLDGAWRDAALHERERLEAGDEVAGPAMIVEATGVTVIDPGWVARVTSRGELLLSDEEGMAARSGPRTDSVSRGGAQGPDAGEASVADADSAHAERADAGAAAPPAAAVSPIDLEIFNHHFAAIAEEMGAMLRRTALSVNVKERLDFSCAVFTGEGGLVANAPHMPVHLGAMSETVRCVLRDVPDLEPGDVVLTNDPFRGGSHLPDITVVTPVFDAPVAGAPAQNDSGTAPAAAPRPLFFAASRAHHAEVGGIRPGSMPPDSRTLEEEGVVLRAFKVIDGGRPRFDELRRLLVEARWPSRAPDENLADVAAQIAANQLGARRLLGLMESAGRDTTLAYMRHIQAAAEAKMRQALRGLGDGEYAFADRLDDGSPIRVRIMVSDGAATLDFAGTAPPLESNLNANVAIVKAAVIYTFRCLIDEDIPLNEGVLAPLTLRVPRSLLDPPAHDDPALCPAVVGGNVETSQRVTDVLLGALRLAAASQGTMNNLTFGDATFGYYETICGGAGAGPGFAGADAVHTHMTNTRLTDPEVLEARFPVRVVRFEIRRGSGGAGRWRGGDGCRRVLEFLAPLEVSILSQRRTTRPFGLAGGEDGAPGRNVLYRAGESEGVDIGGVATFQARPGDRLVIETPGGGGWGAPSSLATRGTRARPRGSGRAGRGAPSGRRPRS